MKVKSITLTDFRNFDSASVSFTADTNVICGSNAQGKTNLTEAVWLLTGNRSFRGSRDIELVKQGKERSVIKAEFFADGRDQTAELYIGSNREAVLNGVKLQTPSELNEKFRAVVFSPDDLSLISEGPSERRHFCDTVISGFYPRYAEKSARYTRALEQRKYVLKDYRTHPELDVLLDDFEAEIVKAGKEIIIYRKRFLERLSEYLPEIYSGLSGGKESISAEYISTGGVNESEFRKKLISSRETDAVMLSTSVGPHRDDVEILINGISARKFASQGQKRSAAITLRLAEAKLTEAITGTSPIILLDDVMSELDPTRQKYILNHIKGRQVLITCCDPENTKGLKAGKVIEIKDGVITEKISETEKPSSEKQTKKKTACKTNTNKKTTANKKESANKKVTTAKKKSAGKEKKTKKTKI